MKKYLLPAFAFALMGVLGACSTTKAPMSAAVNTTNVADAQDSAQLSSQMYMGNISPTYWGMLSRLSQKTLVMVVVSGKECSGCSSQRMHLQAWTSAGVQWLSGDLSLSSHPQFVKNTLKVDQAGTIVAIKNGQEVGRSSATGEQLSAWVRQILSQNGYDISRYPTDTKWPENGQSCSPVAPKPTPTPPAPAPTPTPPIR